MTKDEALKFALEALTHLQPNALTSFYTIGNRDKAIKAIREALSQPEQEQDRQIDQLIQERDHRDEIIDKLCDAVLGPDRYEWSSQYFFEDAVREVEKRMAALEAQPEQDEKFCDSNCVWTDHHPDCKMAQPEQEPVAWMDAQQPWDLYKNKPQLDAVPLYTVPPHRKPLTDEEIKRMAAKWFLSMYWPLCNTFARAIEAKLKEKNT